MRKRERTNVKKKSEIPNETDDCDRHGVKCLINFVTYYIDSSGPRTIGNVKHNNKRVGNPQPE